MFSVSVTQSQLVGMGLGNGRPRQYNGQKSEKSVLSTEGEDKGT